LGIIGGGIYLLVQGGTYAFITGNEYAAAAPLLIVCGVITLVIAILGLIAGLTLWWPLFLIYGIILLIVIVLEIVAAILGFVFQSNLEAIYADRFNATIFSYTVNDTTRDVNQFVDAIQTSFRCCGVTRPENWLESTYYETTDTLPPSCSSGCQEDNSTCIDVATSSGTIRAHMMGCNGTFFAFVVQNAATIGGVGLAFGLIEVIGMVLGFLLCCCALVAKRRKDDYSI
jgi:hypothetical protein